MKLLLDTNIIIRLVEHGHFGLQEPQIWERALDEGEPCVSVVSFWEAEMKFRAGKLPLSLPVDEWQDAFAHLKIEVIKITVEHVLERLIVEPPHRDPFDRLLLCVASSENARLVTLDRVLQGHPLAWRPFP